MLKNTPFDIDGFLREIKGLFHPHITINLKKSAGVPKSISSDQERLKQIMLYVVMKAAKSTRRPKTITISVATEAINANILAFEVTTQGSPRVQENLIQLSQRSGRERLKVKEGKDRTRVL
jgi:hypothetical protein